MKSESQGAAGNSVEEDRLLAEYVTAEAGTSFNLEAVRQAAEAGDVGAQWAFGRHCYASYMSTHVENDMAEAARWTEKAAQQGHTGAQAAMGAMYLFGKGKEQNVAEAEKWCPLSQPHLLIGIRHLS